MRTPPSTVDSGLSVRHYWHGLDGLADTPAFQQWVAHKYPQAAGQWQEPVTRRHFVKIMSASFLLAGLGLTGCRRPEEVIYPFSKMPEHYVHGAPQFFATSRPDRRAAQPLVVKSLDGRPVKVEGNPNHPTGAGGTDHHAQASILDLYDVDRAKRFLKGGNEISRETAFDFLATLAKEIADAQGEGFCFLLQRSSSPSRDRLQVALRGKYPKARWFTHEPVDFQVSRDAASQAHAVATSVSPALHGGLSPYHRPERAKVLVALDCDPLGGEEDGARLIRDFARGRNVRTAGEEPSRLYVLEPLLTLTGANADHRLRLPASQIWAVTAQLTAAVLERVANPETADLLATLRTVNLPAGVEPAWLAECAADLCAHRGAGLFLAGYRQPLAVHLLVQALNHVLGNEGKTVELRSAVEPATESLEVLAQALRDGQVKTLIIVGGNPAYTAPADLDWATTQCRAGKVIRLGYHEDETAALCDWHFPAAHYLESWGDARSSEGTIVSIQPLIAPIFGGLTDLEWLARLGGLVPVNPYEIVRETFRGFAGGNDLELRWKKFLREGYLPDSAPAVVTPPLAWGVIHTAIKAHLAKPASVSAAPTPERLEVIFQRDYRLDDGAFNNNGWLQELPDPITKLTWENVVTLSPKTARALGVYFENPERAKLLAPWVRIELNGRTLEAPVWVQPGQADATLGLALGYGRSRTGGVGRDSGYNAYALRQTTALHFATGARLTSLGREHPLATAQDHWAMEGRPIVREANYEEFRRRPDFAQHMDLDEHLPRNAALHEHPYQKHPELKGLHQWGLAIDLNACVGCSACVVACQSENNIPIVGKDQVARGREMHWIRIERYFSVAPTDGELGNPQVLNLPMFCQHCENAPCEYVCPVNATVHDDEGLNVMVYNRCVGTRYCSNNCPYKVRRFNYFDFNQRPLDRLYAGPLAPKGMPDLVQMAKNPEVTVRMRGVMEKCTYCIQRIEQAKIAQKVKAGASKEVRVPDGTITPACAQACPAEAIVFGDVSDPASRVALHKQDPRNYPVLGFLNTLPRTTFLARIRNPNPRMPDYTEHPLSTSEYARQRGGHETKAHSGTHGSTH